MLPRSGCARRRSHEPSSPQPVPHSLTPPERGTVERVPRRLAVFWTAGNPQPERDALLESANLVEAFLPGCLLVRLLGQRAGAPWTEERQGHEFGLIAGRPP